MTPRARPETEWAGVIRNRVGSSLVHRGPAGPVVRGRVGVHFCDGVERPSQEPDVLTFPLLGYPEPPKNAFPSRAVFEDPSAHHEDIFPAVGLRGRHAD